MSRVMTEAATAALALATAAAAVRAAAARPARRLRELEAPRPPTGQAADTSRRGLEGLQGRTGQRADGLWGRSSPLGRLQYRILPVARRQAAPMLTAVLAAAGAVAGALGPAPVVGCPLLAVAGYRLPAVAAGLRARASRRALRAALPETADLLAVSMSAPCRT